MTAILLFLVGWVLAYYFFRRNKSSAEKIVEKMSVDARRILLSDPREKIGLTDIIDLFHEKIIEEHLDLLGDPFPYKRCPKCGSKKIKRFVLQPDGTVDIQGAPQTPPIAGEEFRILCRTCGYRDETKKTSQQ